VMRGSCCESRITSLAGYRPVKRDLFSMELDIVKALLERKGHPPFPGCSA
jgi:hypothetical protein